jgi:hypothetical protein
VILGNKNLGSYHLVSDQCFFGRFRCAVPCVIVRLWDIAQSLPVVLRVGALVTICEPCGVLRWCGDFSRFGEREVCGCGRRSCLEL